MPPPRNEGTLVMEDARIIFRNFAGKEGQYNREGDRNFCVLLDDDLAATMLEDGWNIKVLRAREPVIKLSEPAEPDQPYIQVSVGYKGRPPRIVIITSKGRTDLGQTEVELLDWVDIKNIDLIIRPYEWSVGGKSGVKAYLKSLFVTIQEDPLELKYAHVQEANERLSLSSQEYMIDAEVIEDDEPRAITSR